jgi:hypothetical protein
VPTATDVLMCHPTSADPRLTSRKSDLTFRDFLHRVITHLAEGGRRVGIKLDFKEADCVAPCLELLRFCGVGGEEQDDVDAAGSGSGRGKGSSESIDVAAAVAAARAMPLWLNADVIRGGAVQRESSLPVA